MAKYRIVTDAHAGFEVQYRPWWSPFWLQCSRSGNGWGTNTHLTVEQARVLVARHSQIQPRSGTVVEHVEVTRG